MTPPLIDKLQLFGRRLLKVQLAGGTCWGLVAAGLALLAGVSLFSFARAVAPAQAVGFSTQSSIASLPAMIEGTQQLGIPEHIRAVVLPLAVSLFRISSPAANLSVAIYCADSRAGQLMLIDGSTGQESDGHDWNNLLTRWGLLEHDTVIARWMRAIAFLVCVGSIIVALWSALQQPREQPREALES